jgi:hypothetical protein
MEAADLRALAKEREARRGVPTPAVAASKPAAPRAPPVAAANLTKALLLQHRSIKLGRSLGYAAMMTAALLVLFGAGRYTFGVLFLGGLGLARGGGALLHNSVLPPMLLEGAAPPSANEIAAAARVGLFSMDGLKALGPALKPRAACSGFWGGRASARGARALQALHARCKPRAAC